MSIMEQPYENEDNHTKQEKHSTNMKQKDKSIINITNINILTQLSKGESESETMDDEFNTLNGYSKGSYRDYEIKVKKAKQYSQTYETLQVVRMKTIQ